jgi:hypothetical protein
MAIALVTKVEAAGASNVTSGAIDTTGANLLVMVVSSYSGGPAPTVSDSKSNSWTGLTAKSSGFGYSRIFYSVPSSVGTSHTFTVSGAGVYTWFSAMSFSGAHATTPYDAENGATTGGAESLATGSVTPSEDNCLVVAALGSGGTGTYTFSIDGSFSVQDQASYVGGNNMPGASATLIQTTAAAANPSWSWTGSVAAAATIASFKSAAGGGGATAVPNALAMMGCGV